jgi:hypothetical protein
MRLLVVLLSIVLVSTSCGEGNVDKVEIAVNKYHELRKDLPKYEIKLMGVFHTDYPNLDKFKTEKEGQINILSTQRQKEIEKLVNELAKDKPTKIFTEVDMELQSRVDTLYNEYIQGKHQNERSELFQIAMRLAKKLGHKKIYASNSSAVEYSVPEKDSIYIYERFSTLKNQEIENHFKASEDFKKWLEENQKDMTMYDIFVLYNRTNFIDNDMVATYFDTDERPFGSDQFPTGWHNRNIRIYSNIRRHLEPKDKVLVIYGADHIPILKHLFSNSVQFKVTQFGI